MSISARETDNSDFGIKIGGFIKNDFFYDSRQTVAAREGHFLLWPARPSLDAENKDINEASSFNFLSIQTRLNASISAPDFFGVKTSGHIEGAFFGHSNADINGFRLRHAYVKFDRENSELLFGQFWNPLFVSSSFPDVVSFNTGCPFQPFSRNPQIRLTQTLGNVKIVAAALSQRDFANIGPAGTSSAYLRNSSMPDLHAQIHYTHTDPGAGTQFTIGGGTAYKKIVPELVTAQGYKTDAYVAGITYMGFARAGLRLFTVKAQYLLGQNVNDLLMIGGYGISRVTDPLRGAVEYAPVRTSSYWLDMHSNGQTVQFGVFLGLSENLGATDNLVEGTGITGFGTDIKSLYRVAPRIVFNSGKARIAVECEYTGANFGTVNISENRRGIPVNIEEVSNFRLLLGVYLFL
ncbi:MAG: hypothetical protein EA408_10685 [Marinilabiliales bacterium]|nr:MAG: hypothetical protein EA408_10685 [Marinilabiliales bacterium]